MYKKELQERVQAAFVEAKTSVINSEEDRQRHENTEKAVLRIIRDLPSPTIEHQTRGLL